MHFAHLPQRQTWGYMVSSFDFSNRIHNTITLLLTSRLFNMSWYNKDIEHNTKRKETRTLFRIRINKRHPIRRPFGRTFGRLFWALWRKIPQDIESTPQSCYLSCSLVIERNNICFQYFELSSHGEIFRHRYCLDTNDGYHVVLIPCHHKKGNQEWNTMPVRRYTQTKMSSFWRNFHHWLPRTLSKWQRPGVASDENFIKMTFPL